MGAFAPTAPNIASPLTESPTEVIGREGSLPIMIDEGLDEFKGQGLKILPAEGVVWCEAPKSATQSCIEVGGGWSGMVLKEFMSDYWS
jgi:hypothetical protein